jgi:hypothetical protein
MANKRTPLFPREQTVLIDLCDYVWEAWGNLLHSAHTGENAFDSLNGKSIWDYRLDHPEQAGIFNREYAALFEKSGFKLTRIVVVGRGAVIEAQPM